VLVVSVFIRLTSGQSLMNMVAEQETAQLKEAVQSYYTTNKTLDGFFDAYIQNNMQIQNPPPPGGYEVPPVMQDIRGIHGLVDTEYRTLIPMFGFELGVVMPEEMIKDAIPVEVDGETVAWILPDKKFQFNLSKEEQLFLQRTTWAIAMAALAGVLVAVAMGFLLAGGMLKPIRRLTAAAQSLAHGDLQQQVPVTSKDELGLLTSTFNQMSTDLAEADQKRKRMTADITHDLSTPLQIISGYMELLEDGEVTLSPQRIDIIKTEIEHLRRLVGDLTTLTQAEAGGLDIQIHPVHPGILMERIYQAYQPICARQGVELVLDIPEAVPAIQVDEGRMMQVLKNLVENALRYTPGGGRITLAVQIAEQVELKVIDGGSGIEPEDLPYVFDRFFRADKARGANSGKMGLGLAICKALVTAQSGTILAESAGRDQGTTIVIRFPSS